MVAETVVSFLPTVGKSNLRRYVPELTVRCPLCVHISVLVHPTAAVAALSALARQKPPWGLLFSLATVLVAFSLRVTGASRGAFH